MGFLSIILGVAIPLCFAQHREPSKWTYVGWTFLILTMFVTFHATKRGWIYWA
jgi:hypothetical protein